ncbi:glycosyltransferase family 39 protein [Pelagibius sp. CAU 1746]|uniref:ArnT family glycosyltransferase n=1 Tax=Pelagibius sp. CAU 1746 TaxID=3140370 RepID=UPI00325B6F13
MYTSGNWLVPQMNGQPYSHKPPLLFWMINLAWSLGGLSTLAARLVVLATGIASAALTGLAARLLWPRLPGIGPWSVMTFAAIGLVTVFTGLVMFDGLLTACLLLSTCGLLLVWRRGKRSWWALVAIGLGLGILAKGPVALLHLLAVGALASLVFARETPGGLRGWFLGLGAAVVGGIAIALAWAVPAAIFGGPEYREMILWGQTAERMVKSFAHARPFWYYLPLLPLFALPWGWWPPLWRWLRRDAWRGSTQAPRFCAIWFATVFVAFSLISGKQIHYLLPALPALALIAARAIVASGDTVLRQRDLLLPLLPMILVGLSAPLMELADAMELPGRLPQAQAYLERLRSDWPGWALLAVLSLLLFATPRRAKAQAGAIAGAVALALSAGHMIAAAAFATYDWSRIADTVHRRQSCGLAWFGDYSGEFGYLARVTEPVSRTNPDSLEGWLAAHPGGVAINKGLAPGARDSLPPPDEAMPYRGKTMALWISPGAPEQCR